MNKLINLLKTIYLPHVLLLSSVAIGCKVIFDTNNLDAVGWLGALIGYGLLIVVGATHEWG